MIEYARAMYSAWSQGHTPEECLYNIDNFIYLCAITFAREPREIVKILGQEPWWPAQLGPDSYGT
jgi:predicted RNase H-like HicB family nuclease